METYKELPLIAFETVAIWQEWLEEHHLEPVGLWLKFAKKDSGLTTLTYKEARNLAIAYGWIDGLINKYDANYYVIRFTPRKVKSGWSKINREVVEALITEGVMTPAGMAHVEAAKQDGRWELAYDPPSTMKVPADFEEALSHNVEAKNYFSTLQKSNRYAFLYRLQTAKTPEKRTELIKKFTEMLGNGQVFHPTRKNT